MEVLESLFPGIARESPPPPTWYGDKVNTIFLYCGTDRRVNTAFADADILPLGGYFAGDDWKGKEFLESVLPYEGSSGSATLTKDTVVYAGAGTVYKKLRTLPRGMRVTILRQIYDGKWVRIKSNNEWSCVHRDNLLLDRVTMPLVEAVPSTDDGKIGTGKMTASVYVRTGPGTENPSLGKIAKETYVALDEKSGGWYRIRSFKTFSPAWVNANYVKIEDKAAD